LIFYVNEKHGVLVIHSREQFILNALFGRI
jgi:hypothetical protein